MTRFDEMKVKFNKHKWKSSEEYDKKRQEVLNYNFDEAKHIPDMFSSASLLISFIKLFQKKPKIIYRNRWTKYDLRVSKDKETWTNAGQLRSHEFITFEGDINKLMENVMVNMMVYGQGVVQIKSLNPSDYLKATENN